MKGLKKFDDLVEAFMNLPGVGKKSAMRFAYFVVLKEPFVGMKISHAIENAIGGIKKCSICGSLSEDEICELCLDEHRNDKKLCIVESAKDILILEQSNSYDGKYFVLESIEDEYIERLKTLIKQREIEEIIFALTPSLANDTVIFFIEDKLKDFNIRFSKIAQGIPTGVTLENVDMLSISKAISDRVEI